MRRGGDFARFRFLLFGFLLDPLGIYRYGTAAQSGESFDGFLINIKTVRMGRTACYVSGGYGSVVVNVNADVRSRTLHIAANINQLKFLVSAHKIPTSDSDVRCLSHLTVDPNKGNSPHFSSNFERRGPAKSELWSHRNPFSANSKNPSLSSQQVFANHLLKKYI